MRTAYLIKSEAYSINFDCQEKIGLTFVTSVQDIRFLHNVVLDKKLKILVQQDDYGHGIGKPTLWFLVYSDAPVNTTSLETEWKFTTQFGALLNKYTQLGQSFSYKNIWTFPNIPNEWILNDTYIQFNEKGGCDGIYWDDVTKPTYQENGNTLRQGTLKQVKADLVLVLGSDNMKTQAHFAHITLPGKNNIDTSGFYLKKDIGDKMAAERFEFNSKEEIYLLQLYNRAITTEDIFISTLLLYQMIEVVIQVSNSKKIDDNGINKLKDFVNGTEELKEYSDRILNSIYNITTETSKELLLKGLIELIGEEKSNTIDISDFKNWRILRGSLTHPLEARELTEEQFVKVYKTLRKFCSILVQKFY